MCTRCILHTKPAALELGLQTSGKQHLTFETLHGLRFRAYKLRLWLMEHNINAKPPPDTELQSIYSAKALTSQNHLESNSRKTRHGTLEHQGIHLVVFAMA
ncbi:hypothetical protein VFPPC_17558 [Pochonia chlamydosporia 170]|uniref:Uncharacterized protein n=1 Tax=Pochonia chlamydosporia 170 TaxID=1380566 RepID=A0A219ARS4_METCM|nr:hypothetical protein VFPPC_17558 [Pochonia chlamydosporia 170]OWT43279.1 hypothetical protein VFPPC_17558 [Pochonia chlamydosporia 170]